MDAPTQTVESPEAQRARSMQRMVSRRDALKKTLDAFEAFCFVADGETPEIVEELAPRLRLYKSEYQCLVTLTKAANAQDQP